MMDNELWDQLYDSIMQVEGNFPFLWEELQTRMKALREIEKDHVDLQIRVGL